LALLFFVAVIIFLGFFPLLFFSFSFSLSFSLSVLFLFRSSGSGLAQRSFYSFVAGGQPNLSVRTLLGSIDEVAYYHSSSSRQTFSSSFW
jgi:hypothetical protein